MPGAAPANPDIERAAQAEREADASFSRADYSAAETLYTEALALYEACLGSNHPSMALSRLGLGRVRNAQGRFPEARELVQRALATLDRDNADASAAHYALGEIVSNLGDLREGIEHVDRSFEIRRKSLGPAHPETLDSMSLLATLIDANGEGQAARQIIADAAQLVEQYDGEPVTAIGKVYLRLGRILSNDPTAYEPARRALERALAIFERSQGPDHPYVGITLNNLGSLLENQDEWSAARPLLERSLLIHQRAYGTQSPFSIRVLANLAEAEKRSGSLDSAYNHAAGALIVAVRSFGPRSPQAVSCLRRLVVMQAARAQAGDPNALDHGIPFNLCLLALEVAQGKGDPQKEMPPGARLAPEKAAQRLERLVDGLAAELSRPPRTVEEQAAYGQALAAARALAAQGDMAMKQENTGQAHSLYQQALAAQEAVLGPDHLDHRPLLEKLAKTNEALGHPTAVLPLLERIVAISAAQLGEDHPRTLMAMTELYLRTSYEYGKEAALPLMARTVALREESLGPDDPFSRMARESLRQLREGQREVTDTPAIQRGPSRSERYEAALAEPVDDPTGVLAGLEAIDWHRLHHAYGPADDTPRNLRLLLSSDEQVSADAWEALHNTIWHQGSIYEATAAAVPFLIRMLDHGGPHPPHRLPAMDLLAGLGGSCYPAAHSQSGDEEVDPVAEQLNLAVGEGTPRYLALLDDPDSEVRSMAFLILSEVRGHEAETAPQIIARLARLSDPSLRAAALFALRRLLDDSPDSALFFEAWMRAPGEDPRVIFQAAMGIVERASAKEATGDMPERTAAAVDALLTTWPLARQVADQIRPSSHASRFFRATVHDLQVLTSLGVERGASALARALHLADSIHDLLDLAGVMLDLLFHAGQMQHKSRAMSSKVRDGRQIQKVDFWSPAPQPARDPASLDAEQRAALGGLLDFPGFWQVEHNLLGLYGLPTDRADLRRFLEASRPLDSPAKSA